MPTRPSTTLLRAVPLVILALALGASAASADRPPGQVVLELGGVFPQGNLGDDFFTTEAGLGVKTGLETGFRWRHALNERWSISPSFHFVNFKDFKGMVDGRDEFRIRASGFRYMLEVMWSAADQGRSVRPFLAVAAGLYRNRLEGLDKDLDGSFDGSVNTFGVSARAGVVLGQLECSVIYSRNSFETWTLFRSDPARSYDWSTVGGRVGWAIPFGAG